MPAVASRAAAGPVRSAWSRGAALVASSHPGPTVVVTSLCGGLAAAAGAPRGTVLLVVAVVLAGQLSIGWSNDWLDAARDRAVGRTDKPVAGGAVGAGVVRTAAFVALAASVALSLPTGAAAVHGGAVALGWAYNLGLKGTVASWVPYGGAFAALPAFVVLALPGDARPAGWLLAVGAALGVGAHLANVLPDLADDAATGVRGLPHRLGGRAAAALAPVVLAVAVVLAVVGPPGRPAAAAVVLAVPAVGVAVVGGFLGARGTAGRWPFRCAMAVAAACVGVVAAGGTNGLATGL